MAMVGGDKLNPHKLALDPHGIPSGANNKFLTMVSYYFGVVDYYTGYLKMTDANN